MNKSFWDGYNKAIRDVVQHLKYKKEQDKEPIGDELINEIKIMSDESIVNREEMRMEEGKNDSRAR